MTFDVGDGVACDLDRLIAGRLLVQASSGQGKTWAIRRLLEQTYGKVQHLVIDPEGEYFTLREKFDYVHAAAKGGDVVAHPKYAATLATELLKLGASAILDIYELNPQDRKAFVRHFCTALVNAPRELWHPCLIVLDEAHVFAPEKDQAESAEAVKALASRGRKRAFCLVMATQRLSKLAKDAAAEMGNKLIGGCRLDIDVKRAAEELGFTDVAQRQTLRLLKPGQFFASGTAFTGADTLVTSGGAGYVVYRPFMVGKVKTTHPEPGQTAAPTPPASEKVRAVLKRLEALPAEAEEREKSIETLKKENAELRRHVASKVPGVVERVEVPVLRVEESILLTDAAIQLKSMAADIQQTAHAAQHFADVGDTIERLLALAARKVDGRVAADTGTSPSSSRRGEAPSDHPAVTSVGRKDAPTRAAAAPASGTARGHHTLAAPSSLDAAQRKIINVVAELERRELTPNVEMIARWLGIHPNGGRYRGNLRALTAEMFLNADYMVTDIGLAHVQQDAYAPGLFGLPIEPAQRVIVDVLEANNGAGTIEEIADMLGLHPNGGRFRGNVRWLVTMGVLELKNGLYRLTEAATR